MLNKVRCVLEKHGYNVTKMVNDGNLISGSVQWRDDLGIGFGQFTVSENKIIIVTGEGHKISINMK